ncbi:MAG TPA: alpha/beta hydrolase [Candidatus Sulfotelmatobacter sp.]|nr:alpha/beta hydrolase [Candidatus Sulfotelmatobacter sp.]
MTRTMVLVHGAFVGGWCWEPFALHFRRAGWRCLAPDLRHHGPDAPLDRLGDTSLKDYAADIAALIRTLPEPPVLVGHSMGGLICQKLAAEGLAEALVLLAPSPPWGVLSLSRSEIEARFGLLAAGPFWTRALRPSFRVAASHALDKLEPAAQSEIFARFVPESGRALFEILYWPLDFTRASAVNARAVDCPILIAVGSEDKVVPPGTVQSVARLYRGAVAYHEFPGHSHFLFGEPGFERIPAFCDGWLRQMLAEAEGRQVAE